MRILARGGLKPNRVAEITIYSVAACYKRRVVIAINDFLKAFDGIKDCLIAPAAFKISVQERNQRDTRIGL